jgi:hypothetical protein
MSLFSGIKRRIGGHAGAALGGALGGGAGLLTGGYYDATHQQRPGAPNYGELRRQQAGAYNAAQIGLEQQNEAERQRREQALTELDRGYADPSRMAGMEKLYQANLGNQIAGLQQGFRQQSQKAGLAAARRGRLGSSFDTEQQAGLQHGLQQDIMGAESEAYGGLDRLRQADEAQHQALRRALLAGDPQTAAAMQQQAAGYGMQTQSILEAQRMADEARRRQEQNQQQNYQTLGDVLSSGGAGVQNYFQYRGY